MSKKKHDNGFPIILLLLACLFVVSVDRKAEAADDDNFRLGEF